MKIAIIGNSDSSIQKFTQKFCKNNNKTKICKFNKLSDFYRHINTNSDIQILIFNSNDSKIYFVLFLNMTIYNNELYYSNIIRHIHINASYEKFKKMLSDAIHILDKKNNETNGRYFIEKNEEGITKIYYKDITYIETSFRKTLIHINDSVIISNRNMKMHAAILDERFFRCHSGFIINMNYIKAISNSDIKLETGDIIPLSKHRKKEFLNIFKKIYGNIGDVVSKMPDFQ